MSSSILIIDILLGSFSVIFGIYSLLIHNNVFIFIFLILLYNIKSDMLYTKLFTRFSTHALSSPDANINLLRQFGIVNPRIFRNLTYHLYLYSVPEYYESGINFTPSDSETRHNALSDTGAFVAYSGSKTGYAF